MVISTKELLNKYRDYKNPKMKIHNEVKKGNLIYINRGLYETEKNTPGHLLGSYIKSPSYLSFEYVLAFYSIIPEFVYVYTLATTKERHITSYTNSFGSFEFRDVPSDAFLSGVQSIEENGYTYFMATKEKALCDLLYTKPPLNSKKQLLSFLIDSLRIDLDDLKSMNHDDIIELADLYKSTNLKIFKKIMEDFKNGKYPD